MKYQKLRFAWSVAWGIVAVTLIALWIRSYFREDVLNVQLPNRAFSAWRLKGTSVITTGTNHGTPRIWLNSFPANHPMVGTGLAKNEVGLGFGGVVRAGGFFLSFPNWFPGTLASVMAVTPWFLVLTSGMALAMAWARRRKRFSLRTLLINRCATIIHLQKLEFWYD